MRWEEELYFNDFAFSRKNIAFPQETVRFVSDGVGN